MAEIRPFPGIHYNPLLVEDLSKVICPPYDIISPAMEQELRERSPYNFVRVEYGRQLPQDTAEDNKYTRSALTLRGWLDQGMVVVDEAPAIYLHDHYFSYQGRQYRRRGMIVSVRLEEWDKMVVRPHEATLARPRSDRLNLLWALGVNTSPIMALFADSEQKIAALLALGERDRPVLAVSEADGESHEVRAITEPEIIARIAACLVDQPVYIADGHHRYESALTYQRERRACAASPSEDEAYNFVMMTLVDFADSGLVVLPPHRLVRGVSRANLAELAGKLGQLFDVGEMPLETAGVWQQVDRWLSAEGDRVKLAILGLVPGQVLTLKLRERATVSQIIPYFHSEQYKSLDVSIIDHVILEEFLGLDRSRQGEALLAYNADRDDAVSRVLDGEYQLAFLLSPVKVGVIKAMADTGERMPGKSTYFHPKLPAGLVFSQVG
ncbi:DUF1015 domain-containing protein [Chloroflexota bacterium]